MSRIGMRPIKISDGVLVDITPLKIVVSKETNKIEVPLTTILNITMSDNEILVGRKDDTKKAKSQQGLVCRLLTNAIAGVRDGFTKELTFTGTGYRAAINGNELVLNMGYSHEIKLLIPGDLEVSVKKNSIIVTGIDKTKVGQFAAMVREVRPPEVYKGKGIKYSTENIKRKAGKKASA